MTKKAGATGGAVAAVGVLAASLAHFGMLGDDVARGTRALLRNVGAYHEAILTVDDGARAITELKRGDQGERLAIQLACQVITTGAKAELSVADWKVSLSARMPSYVVNEPTGKVDGAVEKAATILSIWQENPRAGLLYAQKCGGLF